MGSTCTRVTWPVSLFRAAIPVSRETPRPSRRAMTWLPSGWTVLTAVWGRDWAVQGREAVTGRDEEAIVVKGQRARGKGLKALNIDGDA